MRRFGKDWKEEFSSVESELIDMTILFLHGWHSSPGGKKPTFFENRGHRVINPALPADDFEDSLKIAQAAYDKGAPDLVIGSSRGGAVALNLQTGDTPIILVCPAWKNWGTAQHAKPRTVIMHSRTDEVIPFAQSEELLAAGPQGVELVECGRDHRMAEPETLARILEVAKRLVQSRE